jgi:hypothetical protein
MGFFKLLFYGVKLVTIGSCYITWHIVVPITSFLYFILISPEFYCTDWAMHFIPKTPIVKNCITSEIWTFNNVRGHIFLTWHIVLDYLSYVSGMIIIESKSNKVVQERYWKFYRSRVFLKYYYRLVSACSYAYLKSNPIVCKLRCEARRPKYIFSKTTNPIQL